jgi:hypothetical protein
MGNLLSGDPLPRFASSPTPPARGGVLGSAGCTVCPSFSLIVVTDVHSACSELFTMSYGPNRGHTATRANLDEVKLVPLSMNRTTN